jgi:hypothetical protein
LLVISLAQTKLTWYNAPVIPFLSLIVASSIVDVKDFLFERFDAKRPSLRFTSITITTMTCIGVAILSLNLIHQASELTIPGLQLDQISKEMSELQLDQIFKEMRVLSPQAERYFFVVEDERIGDMGSTYNPQILFYSYAAQLKGYSLKASSMKRMWSEGDTLVSCKIDVSQSLRQRFRVQKLHSNPLCSLYVISQTNLQKTL